MDGPWDVVAVDVCTFTLTNSGNINLIVFVNLFTKYVIAIPTADQTAQTVCDIFIERVITQHGVPRKLLSDKGSNFTLQLVEEVCKLLNTKKIFTTPYHPEGDGQMKRTNRMLQALLASHTHSNQPEWDKYVPYAVFAYNCSLATSTSISPFYLNHGRHPNLPLEVALAPKTFIDASPDDYKDFVAESMEKVIETVKG